MAAAMDTSTSTPTATPAPPAPAAAAAVAAADHIIAYLPQKPVKNWIGIAVAQPDTATNARMDEFIRRYVEKGSGARVTVPQHASTIVENYHLTLMHGLDEPSLTKAYWMTCHSGLQYGTDITPVLLPATGQQRLRCIAVPDQRKVYLVADFQESPKVHALRQAMTDAGLRASDGKIARRDASLPLHVTLLYIDDALLRPDADSFMPVSIKVTPAPVSTVAATTTAAAAAVTAAATPDVKQSVTTVAAAPAAAAAAAAAGVVTASAEDTKQPPLKPLLLCSIDTESTGHIGEYELLSVGWFAVEIPRVITFDVTGRMLPPPIIRSRGRVSIRPTRPFEKRTMKQFWSHHPAVLKQLLQEAGTAEAAMRTFFQPYDKLFDRYQVVPLSDRPEHDMGYINRYAHTVLGRPPIAFSADASIYVGSVCPDEFVYDQCSALYGTSSRTFSAMCYERVKAHIDARYNYTHLPDDDARNIAWLTLAKLYSCGPALGTDFESRAKPLMAWIDSALDDSTPVSLPPSVALAPTPLPPARYLKWNDVIDVVRLVGAQILEADGKRGIDTKAADYVVSDETIASIKHPMLFDAARFAADPAYGAPWWDNATVDLRELEEPAFKAALAAIDAAVAALPKTSPRGVLILDTEGLSVRPGDLPPLQIGNLIVDADTLDETSPFYAGTAVCKLPVGSKMDHRTLVFWYRKNMAVLENYAAHPEQQFSPFQMAVWQAHLLRGFDEGVRPQRAGDGGLVYDYEQIDSLANTYERALVQLGYCGRPYWKHQTKRHHRLILPKQIEHVVTKQQRQRLQSLAATSPSWRDVQYGGLSLNEADTIDAAVARRARGHTHDALDDVRVVAARARAQMHVWTQRLSLDTPKSGAAVAAAAPATSAPTAAAPTGAAMQTS